MSSENNYLNDQYKSFFEDSLSKTDPELHKAINDELKRQQEHIELIASENIVSQAVLEAQGSVLTNKYSFISNPSIALFEQDQLSCRYYADNLLRQ